MRQLLYLIVFLLGVVPSALRAETVTIDQFGFYFSPREITIHPGDTVRWRWSSGSHTVTEGTDGVVNGNELFHSSLTSGTQTYSFTFTPAFLASNPHPGGRYDFFCAPHFSIGMNGVVWVAQTPPGSVFCAGDGSATPCPCANNNTQPTGCLNSQNRAARLRARGTASVASDSLLLTLEGAPESNFVLLFQGATALNGGLGIPFGDGLRCAGGASRRLAIKAVSFGWLRFPESGDPTVSVQGGALPGTTLHYQGWYRDAASTCSGSFYNTSNGYSVLWQP